MKADAFAATAQGVARRMAAAAPQAWRHDKVFRWASIGTGVTFALLLLRLADSPRQGQSPGESRPAVPPPTAARSTTGSPLPALGMVPSAAVSGVPKVAPSQPLNGAVVAPVQPDGDRFGTVAPASHP